MKKNTLVSLVAIIVVLIIVSIFVNLNSTFSRSDNQSAGQKIIPKLYDRLNDVINIEIINNSGNIVIEKSDSGWNIKSKNNYPGNITQIRNVLVALAELEKVEAKTKKEKNYSKLGVQALSNNSLPVGQSTHITINTATEKLASIIIGNQKSGHTPRAGGIKKLNYVRLTDDAQVWLTAGNVTIPTLNNFMNTELVKIPVARIKSVKIQHAKDSSVQISKTSKTDKEFTLKQLPKNKELSPPGILNSIASVLSNFNFEDVSAKSNDAKFDKPIKAEFTAFNGLIVNLNIVSADNKHYLWFGATASEATPISLKQEDVENKDKAPNAKQEATDINKRHSRWLYTIPSSQGELLMKQLNDIIKPKKSKKSKT